ncbi:Transposon-encoded protein TnpW, partial [Dysosmobacter welbionis]
VLQHTVGEAAGGGADVGADGAVQVDGEGRHGLLQLQPAPADVCQRAAPDLDLGVLRHGGAGLVHP